MPSHNRSVPRLLPSSSAAPSEDRPEHSPNDLASDLAADGVRSALGHGAKSFHCLRFRLRRPSPARGSLRFLGLILRGPLLQRFVGGLAVYCFLVMAEQHGRFDDLPAL